jgi:hypothetical protein
MGILDNVTGALSPQRSIQGGEHTVKVITTRDEGAIETLNDIKALLVHLLDKLDVPEPAGETVTLKKDDRFPFDAHGYRYNALIVNDSDAGTKLKVTFAGVSYTVTLSGGLNQVNIPDGADIVPDNSVTVYLIRTNYEFKTS